MITEPKPNDGFISMGNPLLVRPTSFHRLDCSKLKTVEDIAKVLEGLQISIREGTEAYERLKPFLKEEVAPLWPTNG